MGLLLPDRAADRPERRVAAQLPRHPASGIRLLAARHRRPQHGRTCRTPIPRARRRRRQRAYRTLLTTFSTPFGGVPAARLALTLGAYAVPSWRDLTPDSAFLRALKSAALPKTVKHHVFFAYQQDGGDRDSDGVISVASELADGTAHTHGFRTDIPTSSRASRCSAASLRCSPPSAEPDWTRDRKDLARTPPSEGGLGLRRWLRSAAASRGLRRRRSAFRFRSALTCTRRHLIGPPSRFSRRPRTAAPRAPARTWRAGCSRSARRSASR